MSDGLPANPVRQVLLAAGGYHRAVGDGEGEDDAVQCRRLAQVEAVAVGADDGLLAGSERSGGFHGAGWARGVEQDGGEQRPGQEQTPKRLRSMRVKIHGSSIAAPASPAHRLARYSVPHVLRSTGYARGLRRSRARALATTPLSGENDAR